MGWMKLAGAALSSLTLATMTALGCASSSGGGGGSTSSDGGGAAPPMPSGDDSGGGDDASAVADASNGRLIGPSGGTVIGPNGARIIIPAGALSLPVMVTITEAPKPANTSSFVLVSKVYAFAPSHPSFAKPVTITVPFDPALAPRAATAQNMLSWSEGTSEPAVIYPTFVDTIGNTYTASTTHLGEFAAGELLGESGS